jgi:hypothetical protein
VSVSTVKNLWITAKTVIRDYGISAQCLKNLHVRSKIIEGKIVFDVKSVRKKLKEKESREKAWLTDLGLM